MLIIKKYKNRKLYVDNYGYISLKDISELVKKGDSFKVVDYKDIDVTNKVLKSALNKDLLTFNDIKKVL